jgi:pimeloyl-ACP methyl ester carboxylesterase
MAAGIIAQRQPQRQSQETDFMRKLFAALATLCWAAAAGAAQPAYGPELQGFDYPFPLQHYAFTSQRQPVAMAFMDIAPAVPNGRTVVLLHGKNFCAATWEGTARALSAAGFRVIMPDQIGFCGSTKPQAYQFTFQQLAANTHALLAQRGVARAVLIGHSMGGMLAMRYALMYPDSLERLVVVNPLGLQPPRAGATYSTLDENYARELKTSFATIKAYQLGSYYHNEWRPEYDRWVTMLAGLNAGPGKERVAWNQAQTSEMIATQNFAWEFDRIGVPTSLLIGSIDRFAEGAEAAAAKIPQAKLIRFDDLGHSPHVEAPQRFMQALLTELAR